MFTLPFIAVASLLLSFFPLAEKVEYSIAEITIAKKASLAFSIGQLELHKAGGVTSIDLLKTPDDNHVMMISEPFTVTGGDSIYFRRTMAITGPGVKKLTEKDVSVVKFDETYSKLEASSQRSGVKLQESLFNKESHIQIITDLMYQGESEIVASLDTLTVKRNSNGYLKGYTAAFKPEAIKMALNGINPSRPVVVRVWIQLLLPENSKFTIKTSSRLRDKKPYNIIALNPSMIVPGYTRTK